MCANTNRRGRFFVLASMPKGVEHLSPERDAAWSKRVPSWKRDKDLLAWLESL